MYISKYIAKLFLLCTFIGIKSAHQSWIFYQSNTLKPLQQQSFAYIN